MGHSTTTVLRVGIGLGCTLTLFGALAAPAAAARQDKVTICHATDSVGNPYDEDTVSENAIVQPDGTPTGHGEHTGPIYPEADWGDIIPPFEYNNLRHSTSEYRGLNWTTDGQAIWNGGCLVVPTEPPPETTTTTTHPEVTTTTHPEVTTTSHPVTTTTSGSTTTSHPEVTTTTSGSTTTTHPEVTTTTSGSTTTSSSSSSTTTSHPGSSTTTTTLPPTTTPTTAPPSELPPPVTDPGEGVETLPPVEAVVVDPGPVVVDLGMLSDSQRVSLEAEVDAAAPTTTTTTQPPAPLAHTGLNVSAMVLAALSLIVAGALLFTGSCRPSRRGTK
jgi:hypothetical protein